MRILFLSPRQVLPTRSGAKLREFHLLKALGRAANVTYLYFRDPGSEGPRQADLPFCREVTGVPKPAAYGPLKVLKGLTGPVPLPLLNYTSTQMHVAVEQALAREAFDLIHLDSIHMLPYAEQAAGRQPRARVVYNWHNIESEAMRRFASTTASFARRVYALHTARGLERVERGILRDAFGHIVCSERECLELRGWAPGARIEIIENGVDTSYFAGSGTPPAGACRLVFVGAMDYFPNADGAIHFVKSIWPEVKRRLPDASLTIVGANPGPAVLELKNASGVEVTGMVPDVRPYYGGATAAVVPLRTGGGTRLKILEAMAAGVPVVSTPLGAEGLGAVDGVNAALVGENDIQGWGDVLVRLTEQEAVRQAMVAAGRELVETRYDWGILGARLCGIYEGWQASG